MWLLLDVWANIRDFLEAGGYVLWAILLLSTLLWTLIFERYLFLRWVYPPYLAEKLRYWQQRPDRTSWYARKIREALLSEISLRLNRSLGFIGTLIAICPLMGLLGTVIGMVHVFDVMAHLGSGNARAMATGISLATIPTMAGMVVALSGLFFSAHLQQRVEHEDRKAAALFFAHPNDCP